MANAVTETIARVWTMRPVRLIVIVVAGIALGFGLLVGSALLPAERINSQIGTSASLLTAEGTYPQQSFLGSTYQRDNYTDAIMLNMAMIYPADPVGTTLRALYYDNPSHDPVSSLTDRVQTGAEPNNPYMRYWQGYVPFLRAVMLVMTYQTWRVVNAVLLLGLMLAAVVQVGRRIGWGSAAALAAALLVAAPTVVTNSLQFSTVFYVAMLGVLAVIYLADRYPHRRFDLELFAVLGMATAYLDFLTAPLVTLGLPLLTLMAYRRAHGADEGGEGVTAAGEGADGGTWWPLRAIPVWGVGYVGFWAVRWVFNAIALNPGTASDVLSTVSQRAGQGMTVGDRFTVILQNLSVAFPRWMFPATLTVESVTTVIVVAAGLYAVVWGALFATTANGGGKWLLARTSPLLVVALLPFGWMLFAANHSANHYFMVYRILTVTVFALGLILVHGVYWPNLVGAAGKGTAGGRGASRASKPGRKGTAGKAGGKGSAKSGARAASGKPKKRAGGR